MAKLTKSITPLSNLKYRRVKIDQLDRGRRGKHHELVQEIFKELKLVTAGSALEIPLTEVGGIGLANLRSAVHRAATSEGLLIETLADEKNFYVWQKTSPKSAAGS